MTLTNQNELYTFIKVQQLENRNYIHSTHVLFNEFQEIQELFQLNNIYPYFAQGAIIFKGVGTMIIDVQHVLVDVRMV